MDAGKRLVLCLSAVLSLPAAAIWVPNGGDACNKTDLHSSCCGLHAFDKESEFCCGGLPVTFPFHVVQCVVKPPAYNWASQTCVAGLSIDMPMSICPDGNMHFCCGGLIADTPVKACVPDPGDSDERCCGLISYNRKHQRCCGRHIVPDGHSGTPSASQCTQPPAMDPDKQICVGGVIYTIPAPECGGQVHYCCGHAILPKTGHWKPQSPQGSLKPMNTADLKPMNTADLKPMNTANLKPMNTADLKPMNTADLKPMNTADLKPMNTADLKPMNTADLFRPMYAAAQRVMPMSQRVMPMSQRVMPMSQRVMPMSQRVMPMSQRVMPMSQRVMPMSVAEVPEPTRKPVTKCGSSPYDADKFICCSGRLYPSIYICCDGQVQGAPIKPACCNKFAFSRLTHKCVDGRLESHY